jgi:outer membrane protein TolC
VKKGICCLALLLCILASGGTSKAQTPKQVITADKVIELAFARNPGIRAARYRLESAQHNFDLFESELSQFTPLVVDTKLERESNAEKGAEITAGMEREFFNGASADLSVGNSSVFESGTQSHAQFVESKIEFPLFSSNTKLKRLSERTFEENDLREARLDYIEEVREQIEDAQETFYERTEAAAMLRALIHHREDLQMLVTSGAADGNDRVEMLDRIGSLESDIREWELRIVTREIQLVQLLAIPRDSIATIEEVSVNVSDADHLGRHYFVEPFGHILKRALTHDTESEILQRVVENAMEKVRLAERGKWDITVAMDGRYNYAESRANSRDSYAAGLGLRFKKFDHNVLRHSRAKALADVRSAEAGIEQREAALHSRIGEHKAELDNIVDRIRQLSDLRASRLRIYTFKRQDYLDHTLSLDELLNASRNLLRAEGDYHRTVAEYLRTIRSLDSLCGVYFAKLGLEINGM